MANKKASPAYASNASGVTKLFIAVTTALAMLAFSAFPLALFFNRPYFWQGLVSGLAEPGQPHSGLFTGIDIAAALFGILFFGYLTWLQRWDRMQACTLGLVVVASLAELATDIFALPAHFQTTGAIPSKAYFLAHPSLMVHLAASFVNSTAFLVSFGLWVLHRRHTRSRSKIRDAVFSLAVAVSVVGGVLGHLYPALSPTLQRIFILCYCYWFIALPYDSLARRRRLRS